jgi:uncharacterized protein DUF6894
VTTFYFLLKCGRQTIADTEGVELPDDTAARAHAVAVGRELMRNREVDTRLWRLQVCDDYLEPKFEVLFAEIDRTISRLPSDLRGSIESVCRTAGALSDAILDVRSTLAEVRSTLARADRFLPSPNDR